jgi:hypothetical protein
LLCTKPAANQFEQSFQIVSCELIKKNHPL